MSTSVWVVRLTALWVAGPSRTFDSRTFTRPRRKLRPALDWNALPTISAAENGAPAADHDTPRGVSPVREAPPPIAPPPEAVAVPLASVNVHEIVRLQGESKHPLLVISVVYVAPMQHRPSFLCSPSFAHANKLFCRILARGSRIQSPLPPVPIQMSIVPASGRASPLHDAR